MKPASTPRGKGPAKARRKTRKEINQEARDRKRQEERRGHAAGSRASDSEGISGGGDQGKQKGPRIGSKTPTPLDVIERVTKQHRSKSEKPMLSSQAELDLLETDERLDVLLERPEARETLNAEDQSWVDVKLGRIDELMQKLGLSCGDEEEEDEEEKQEDMIRLLKGGNQRFYTVSLPALFITLPVICHLVWLFAELQWLSRRQKWLRNQPITRTRVKLVRRTRQRRHRKG